jgi:hypothetical protein
MSFLCSEEADFLSSLVCRDVGKVTNWFRNLRQTARKRAKRAGLDDDGYRDDDSLMGHNFDFASTSRPETPSLQSSSSSANGADDHMDVEDQYDDAHSDIGSEDEHQEAVTPSPDASPSPVTFDTTPARSRHESRRPRDGVSMVVDPVSYAQLDKVTASNFTGVKVEDALLLLSFHKHVVS